MISVILADDHQITRQGLRSLLDAEPDIKVIAEAAHGREAVMLAKKLRPNVILMDVAMPLLNGLEATRQILRDVPDAKILILSCYSDDEYVHQLIEAGALGYLVKQSSITDVVKGIRQVSMGNAFFSSSVSKRLLAQYKEAFISGRNPPKFTPSLTSREMEVLQLIAEGYSNDQIAKELSIKAASVQKHRQQLMEKLNLHDVASLTRYAVSHGIVEVPAPLHAL